MESADIERDLKAVARVRELMAELTQTENVSTYFFLELTAVCWAYLRMLHERDLSVQFLNTTIYNAEVWLQNEPTILVHRDDTTYEVPLYTAEAGGQETISSVADSLHELVNLESD